MYVGTILSNRYTVVSKTNSLSWNNTGDLTVKKEIDKKKKYKSVSAKCYEQNKAR